MEALQQFGIFAGEAFIIVLAIIIVLVVFFALIARSKDKRELEIEYLNEQFDGLADSLKQLILTKKELKEEKTRKKKESKKADKSNRKKIYVLDFDGDIKASETVNLREEISAIIGVATAEDEVVVRLESAGGMVHAYGLAASQLSRIRDHHIPLTVCIDEVAASGGYMMAVVANKIVAAPFAIVGSIGVVAQVPNLHRFLKKHDIDYQELTAGEYKRTISVLGEITDTGKKKFIEQLEDTHYLFKQFIKQYRPQVDLNQVATGEYWYGQRAHELNLLDEIRTSDDYLMCKAQECDVYTIKYHAKKSLTDKLAEALSESARKCVLKVWQTLELRRWG